MSGQQLELWDKPSEDLPRPVTHELQWPPFGYCLIGFNDKAFQAAVMDAMTGIIEASPYIDSKDQEQLYSYVIGAAIYNMISVDMNNFIYQCVRPLVPHHGWIKSQSHRCFALNKT